MEIRAEGKRSMRDPKDGVCVCCAALKAGRSRGLCCRQAAVMLGASRGLCLAQKIQQFLKEAVKTFPNETAWVGKAAIHPSTYLRVPSDAVLQGRRSSASGKSPHGLCSMICTRNPHQVFHLKAFPSRLLKQTYSTQFSL